MASIEDLRAALSADADRTVLAGSIARVLARIDEEHDTRHAAHGVESALELPEHPTTLPVRRADLERTRARGRRSVLVAAASILIVVAGTSVALQTLQHSTTGPGSVTATTDRALSLTRYAFTVDRDPGGLTFTPGDTTTGVQGGFWDQDGSMRSATAALTIGFDPKAIGDISRPAGATSVVIDGHPGWRAQHSGTSNLYFNIDRRGDLTVWQDDSGLWVALLTVGMDPARIAQLAATVHPGSEQPVKFPVRLTHVPADARLSATTAGPQMTGLVFGPHGRDFTLMITPAGKTMVPGQGEQVYPPITAPPQKLSLNGFTGTYYADYPGTTLTNGRIDVTIGYGRTPRQAMPLDQLIPLIKGLQPVGTITEPSSWLPLDQALPHSATGSATRS